LDLLVTGGATLTPPELELLGSSPQLNDAYLQAYREGQRRGWVHIVKSLPNDPLAWVWRWYCKLARRPCATIRSSRLRNINVYLNIEYTDGFSLPTAAMEALGALIGSAVRRGDRWQVTNFALSAIFRPKRSAIFRRRSTVVDQRLSTAMEVIEPALDIVLEHMIPRNPGEEVKLFQKRR
jgi:hypothetical protein